ncbi:MAG: zinc-binding dehydrogenase [Anaerolineae bacterium]
MTIPNTMKAVHLHDYTEGFEHLTVEEVPVPQPGPGEVLVKMAASPINPSDLMLISGIYGFRKDLPAVPGFEGSGTVVAKGPGLLPHLRVGSRVTVGSQRDEDGTWAQYTVAKGMMTLPFNKSLGFEQAAALVVNPLTAYAMVDDVKRSGARAFMQTAAAGTLGGMLWRVGKASGLMVINIVRRAEQVADLRAEGRAYVLNSSEDDFDDRLAALAKELQATIALDAVAGEMVGRLVAALPRGGRVVVYGNLSGANVSAAPGQFILRDKRVEGFWLSQWINDISLVRLLSVWRKVQGDASFRTPVRARYALDDINEALRTYSEQMSGGKVMLRPDGELSG